MRQKNIVLYLSLFLIGLAIISFFSAFLFLSRPEEVSSQRINISNPPKSELTALCQKIEAQKTEMPEVEIAGVYKCLDEAGKIIYEIAYAAEDFGEDYFDSNQNFIVHCGSFGKSQDPKECENIMRYSCLRDINLKNDICKK